MKKVILFILVITAACLSALAQDSTKKYGRVIASANPTNLITDGNGSFALEAISKKGYIGFRIPIIFPVTQAKKSHYMSGFEFKIYPTKQGVIRGYGGISLLAQYKVIKPEFNKNFTAIVMVNGGASWTPLSHLNIQIGGAIGKGTTLHDFDVYQHGGSRGFGQRTYYKIDLTIGFRF